LTTKIEGNKLSLIHGPSTATMILVSWNCKFPRNGSHLACSSETWWRRSLSLSETSVCEVNQIKICSSMRPDQWILNHAAREGLQVLLRTWTVISIR
jgi:hypothetical protein